MSIFKDDSSAHVSIDAMIDVKSSNMIPDTCQESIEVEDASSIFAIIGKNYPCGDEDFTIVSASECGEIDLTSMLEFLKDKDPELFDQLLCAAVMVADEDELEEALMIADYAEEELTADIYLNYEKISSILDEENAADFWADLSHGILDLNLKYGGEFRIACPEDEVIEFNDNEFYSVIVDSDLDIEDDARIECELELEVMRPLFAKYGIVTATTTE